MLHHAHTAGLPSFPFHPTPPHTMQCACQPHHQPRTYLSVLDAQGHHKELLLHHVLGAELVPQVRAHARQIALVLGLGVVVKRGGGDCQGVGGEHRYAVTMDPH